MHLVSDRAGKVTEVNSLQDRFLETLYGSAVGRLCLRPLISPAFSRAGGVFLSTKLSRILIGPFIRSHAIPMEEFERRKFVSYNDFFTRRLAQGARWIEPAPEVFVSPCDGLLSVYKINHKSIFNIKHTRYTVGSLLRNRKLAERFKGGYLWVFRLQVEDFHRYIYVDGGRVSRSVRIPGVFHTVNPAAGDRFPVYKENTREYCLLRTENFGTLLQMEVGAMLVGQIENIPGNRMVRKGQEKGHFSFGGSTVILMTQKGRVIPDQDILDNSGRGIETKVRLGEKVGVSPQGE